MTKGKAPLMPAYLVVGEDRLKRQRVAERMRERLGELGDLSMNSQTFIADASNAAEILAACDTLPFMGEKRLVEIREAERLKPSDAAALASYLENPCETTVLLVECEKMAKNSKLYKAFEALGSGAVISCEPKKGKELVNQVQDMMRMQGHSMGYSAAKMLVDFVGTNTVDLQQSVQKLALAVQEGDAITERDVERVVARTSEAKWWDLLDAMSARDCAKSLALLSQCASSSPIFLLNRFEERLRELMRVGECLEEGVDQRNLASKCGIKEWKVRDYCAWVRGFRLDELVTLFGEARDAEQVMKSGGEPERVFADLIIRVCKG